MACEEKIRLAEEYRRTVLIFGAAVSELQELMATSSKQQYERLRIRSEDARLKCERARIALEDHTTLHGC